MIISFEVVQRDIDRIILALDRLDSKIRRLANQHPFSSASLYQALLKKNMLNQKFAPTYPPYSMKYARWKTETMGLGSSFWRLYGDLFRSIAVFKIGNKAWMAGVPANIYDQGGKSWFSTALKQAGKPKRIAMYGQIEEERRPVFKPTADEFAKDGWIKQGEKDLNELGKQWR